MSSPSHSKAGLAVHADSPVSYRQWRGGRNGLLALVATLLLASSALGRQGTLPAGTEPIDLDTMPGELGLGLHLVLLEDPGGNLSIEDVRRPETASSFVRSTWNAPSFGLTSSAWWARFSLVNNGNEDRAVVLRQDYSLMDHMEVWVQEPDGLRYHATGDRLPFDQRPMVHRDFLFPVGLPAQGQASVWIRFESQGSINITLTLYRDDTLLETLNGEHLVLGVYYGGFIVLSLYNLFLFFGVGERSLLFYVLFVVSAATYAAVQNGLAFQYLWPNSPVWGQHAVVVLTCSNLFWALQFSTAFLEARIHAPRLLRASRALQGVVIVLALLPPFFSYAAIIRIAIAVTLTVTVLIFALGASVLRNGYRPARFFLLGWSVLLIGIAMYVLKSIGLLPHVFVTHYGFQLGSMAEMVLLSIALADKIGEYERQSLTDPLTSLANRRFFDSQFAREYTRAVRYEVPLALLIIDIDHFKRLNDEHGHAEGDAVLRSLAGQLSNLGRSGDSVCRYGGDEFALLLPHTGGAHAAVIAERVRSAIEEQSSNGRGITVSVGGASHSPGSFSDAKTLFKQADGSLYSAKKEGRNRCELAGGLTSDQNLSRLQ